MFLLFSLIIDWYFLIPRIIAHVFNLIAELVILIQMPIKEAKAGIEIQPVTAQAKIKKCSIWFKLYSFFASYSSICFGLFL